LFSLCTPRRVGISLLPRVKEELARMEVLGVIEKVEQPTEWCAGLVVVMVRYELNESVCREKHPLPAVEQTLVGATVFFTLEPSWVTSLITPRSQQNQVSVLHSFDE